MSAIGTKRTSASALHMSAFDPKRTLASLARPPSEYHCGLIRCPVLSLGEAMKRRGKIGGKTATTRRRKTATRRDTPKTAHHRRSGANAEETNVVRLTHERDEARGQQKATAQILQVIRASPTDAQPVFETIVRNAVSLCGSLYANCSVSMASCYILSPATTWAQVSWTCCKGSFRCGRIFPRWLEE